MTRIGSLFSGAGGLDLAALALFPGSSMAWHAEINPAASAVLAHHWPDVPNLGSVTEIDWTAVEPVDVLCGGFPCQDVSAAGRRAGLAEGTRSGLWSHMAAAIDELRPRFVLIENVRGLLSAPAIRGVESTETDVGYVGTRPVLRALGAVLGDLADLGLDAEWTSLRASTVGACHRRERVFILAYPANADCVDAADESRLGRSRRRAVPRTGDAADAASSGRESVDDGTGGAAARRGRKRVARGGAGGDASPVTLLPTPRAGDGTKGGPNQRGSSGDLMLPSAVISLLPTPKTTDNHPSSPADLDRRSPGLRAVGGLLPSPTTSDANGHGRHGNGGPDLRTTVVDLLPTPMASDGNHGGQHPDRRTGHTQQLVDAAHAHGTERWGRYAGAIARQESVSRPAPPPTDTSRKGNPRLAAEFAEWMMMWPAGWVTDPAIGLSRNDQLHAIGNGVCPPQALAAFRYLLGIAEGVIA